MSFYIIISGIPGCGKTTLGRRISAAMGLPMFDKDDILEAMFESLGIGDADWRQKLSRSADEVLQKLVERNDKAIITSWWRHPKLAWESSGTPIEWLSSLRGKITEIYCQCDPAIASKRFRERKRHEGHLDSTRGQKELIPEFEQLASLGPLGVGKLISAYTDQLDNFPEVLSEIRKGFGK